MIKVFVAASWLQHGFGIVSVTCGRPQRQMRFGEMLISGCDSAGANLAVDLRHRVGAARVLNDLRRYGLTELTLQADATDEEWGTTLTLGERDVPVTPAQLSNFLACVASGGGGLFSAAVARQLRTALEGVVQQDGNRTRRVRRCV